MLIAIKALLTALLADFVSGFIHWLEDVYAKPGMRFIHQIAVDNDLHHSRPREFLKNSWWQSSWDLALLSVLLIAITYWVGTLNWEIVLFAVLTTNANQVHKWSHQNKAERPLLVSWLQNANILQSTRHHGKHHSGDKNTHYCVMTNVLNPFLEKIHFWRGLEKLISLFIPKGRTV